MANSHGPIIQQKSTDVLNSANGIITLKGMGAQELTLYSTTLNEFPFGDFVPAADSGNAGIMKVMGVLAFTGAETGLVLQIAGGDVLIENVNWSAGTQYFSFMLTAMWSVTADYGVGTYIFNDCAGTDGYDLWPSPLALTQPVPVPGAGHVLRLSTGSGNLDIANSCLVVAGGDF